MWKSFKWPAFIVVLSMIVFLTGCSLLPNEQTGLVPPLVKPVPDRMETYEVQRETLTKEIVGMAFFEPYQMASHSFQGVDGKVKAIHIQPGDEVRAGDVLIEFETDRFDIVIKERELDYKRKQYELESIDPHKTTELELKQLEVEIAKLQYEEVLQAYQSKTLIAQMDGQVTFVADLKLGDRVHEAQLLVQIADVSQLRLGYETNSSGALSEVELGMEAEVTMNGSKYMATVVQTPSTAVSESDRNNRKLVMTLEEPVPTTAKLGDSVAFTLITLQKEDVLVIPQRALRSYFGGYYVQIVEGESRREVDVVKGMETTTRVEIIEGLKEGQMIVLQ